MLWTVKEAAHYLSVSISTIYKLISENRLSCIRVGDCIRLLPETIESLISNNTIDAGEENTMNYHGRHDINFNSQFLP